MNSEFSGSVQNRKDLWYTIKSLLQMKLGVFLDNHKKSVLWVIDIAKLLAVVCGATLLPTNKQPERIFPRAAGILLAVVPYAI